MAEKTIEEQLNKTSKEIEKASEKLNPAFKGLVERISETNQELGKEIANIRMSAKETFAGALQASKFLRIGDSLETFLKEGESALNPDQFAQLKNVMVDFKDEEWDAYKQLNDSVNQTQEEMIGLEKQKQARIDQAQKQGNVLWKMEQDIQDQKEKLNAFETTGGVVYERELKKLQDMQQAEVDKRKGLTALVDSELKEKQDLLDEEIKERDLFNDKTKKAFQKLNEDAGAIGKFTDGIKDLTGIDLGGMIDGVMGKINSVGKVLTMGKEENLAGLAIEKITAGFGSFTEGFEDAGSIMEKISAVISAVATAMAAASTAFIASMKKMILNMWKHVKKMFPVIAAFIAASIAFVVSLWTTLGTMAAAALAMIAPVLPFLLIGLAIIALAALLIWGGMWLYENSEVFRNAIDSIVGYFLDIVDILGGIFGGFYDFFAGLFTGDWERMFGGLEDIFSGLWDLVLAPFRAISDFIEKTFGIDIGQWLTDKLRDWLPGWALKLLGMGGDSDTDALQAGLIDEVDRKTQKADLASAKESGLYEENWKGDSTIDHSKIAEASDAQLEAIMRDNDISDEDRAIVLETLNQRQIDAGGPDVAAQIAAAKEEGLSGAALAERTAELKEAEDTAEGATVTSNVITTTDNSTNNNLNTGKNAREGDPTLARLSSAGYAFGPFGPDPA